MLCKDNIYQSHCEMKMKFCWFSPPHCYICAIRTKLVSGQKGKKKEILFPFCSTSAAYMFSSGRLLMASCFSLSMAQVYFSMCFNPLCPRHAGDSLDVVAIVEEVHSARMAGTVPTDMLVDAGTFHPSLH